jgi:folate-binding Fe-S cluster repair protein YgfZ
MKHKAELRKGLVRVRLDGAPPPAGPAILAGDRPAGTLLSAAGDRGLAYLRLDRADAPLTAGATRVTPEPWPG